MKRWQSPKQICGTDYPPSIPITHADERLSSVQADRMLAQSGTSNTRDKSRTDSAAAAIIPRSYLDAKSVR